MRSPDRHVVLVHSRFQLFVAQHMVGVVPELADGDRHLVLDMASDAGVDHARWTSVTRLSPPVGGTVRGAGAACRAALRSVESIVGPSGRAAVVLSDIQWPLNNAVWGAIVRPSRGRVVYHAFPDGIGSLVLARRRWRQHARDGVKMVRGLAGGAPYFPYKGDRMGLERAERIYSLLPDAIPELRARTVPIPLLPSTSEASEDACLFLGQPYDRYIPHARYEAIARAAATLARSLGYRRLLYKPHPLEQTAIGRTVFESQGFEVLQDPRAVEELLLERPLACVVSFNSSGLAHLRLLLGDSVRCVAVQSDTVAGYLNVTAEVAAQFRRVFELCGVEVRG